VEVNAQLISTETGAHVWADRFEGERSKLGELQVDVVARLANSLGVELVKAEGLRAERERPNNPDAADLAMAGQAASYLPPNKANLNDAIALFERALALDPQNVRALTGLANVLLNRATLHWSEDIEGDTGRAEKAVDAALALQPDSSLAHDLKNWVYFMKREWKPAIAEAETAIADNPSNARAHAALGLPTSKPRFG